MALFPERAHLVGVYALGKAQRVMALIREAGHDAPIYLHGALEPLTDALPREGIDLGDTPEVAADESGELAGGSCWPALGDQELWSRGFPDPSRPSPRAGCGCAPGPASRASSCRSSSPTIAIGTTSAAPSLETGAGEVWVTHGQEDALVHWCQTRGIKARGPCTCSATATRRGRRGRGASCAGRRDRARGTYAWMIAAASRLARRALGAAGAASELDPKVVAFKLPDQIAWVENARAGNRTAVLQGDPTKSGPYAMLLTWLPGNMSRPHFHPNDRFFIVVSGSGGSARDRISTPRRRCRSRPAVT